MLISSYFPNQKRIKDLISVVWLHFWYVLMINIAVILPISALEKTLGITLLIDQNQDCKEIPKYLFFSLLIGPFFEELIFRLHLSQRKVHFVISVTLFFLFYFFFWNTNMFDWRDLNTQMDYLYLFWMVWLYFQRNQPISIWTMVVSGLFFGLIHTGNFQDYNAQPFYALVASTASISVLGFFLARIRIRHGMAAAISLHIVWNVFIALVK